jgi:protein gp37
MFTQWNEMTPTERRAALKVRRTDAKFNPQDTGSVEWARNTWNPVTGCLHGCVYCYARDIAERFYPQGFQPALHPDRLNAPAQTRVPKDAEHDLGLKNVFVCSMADLFGKWVPDEWIEAVLAQVRANPQWNFLFLTKFPQRMAEFDYPDNAWIGTSVDCQARVKNAERAMRKVKAKVKWVSIEPMLERIHLDFSVFDWAVIGGASRSSQTPEWRPPWSWIWEVTADARFADCRVYHKDNLYPDRLREYPGVTTDEPALPKEFGLVQLKGAGR